MTRRAATSEHRGTAILVGVLFIVATAFLFLGEAFYGATLRGPDYLTEAAPRRKAIIFGLLIETICILAIPMIAAVIYPVLKRSNPSAAVAYVVIRTLEAAILLSVAIIGKLGLIGLSEAYLAQDGADAEALRQIGDTLRSAFAWGDTSGMIYNLVFAFGAFVFYIALYRSRLIPRWQSGWGIAAAMALSCAVLIDPFVPLPTAWAIALVLPIAAQEMVMALWLIFRGFDLDGSDPPA